MPTLPTQSFATIVTNTIAGIQGNATQLLSFSPGSTLRAIVEGFGGLYLWFQALVLQLLTAIRLSTSQGLDVDTFTADFMPVLPGSISTLLPGGSPRLGPQAASGELTFARYTAGPSTCFVPAASAVTAAGVITNAGPNNAATIQAVPPQNSQSYVVIADTDYTTYSATLGGYTMASEVGTLVVPAQAMIAGTAGNVQAGAISTITASLQGIDTVTNVAAFTNGADQESDSALKAKFAAYILGLSRGDVFGLTASIEGAEVTVQWTLNENYNYNATWRPGYFFVVADDGSGNPSPAFLQTITDAANAVRPLSVQCAVFPPQIIFATVQMELITATGYDHTVVVAQVAALIANNIAALGLGNPLPFSILASWAYSIPGVINVPNNSILLNGTQNDIITTVPTTDGLSTVNLSTIKPLSMVIS